MANPLIRVGVVDDHQTFAESLASLLDAQADLVAEAGVPDPGSERRIRGISDADVLLLGGSATHLVAEILSAAPNVRVIVVADLDDPALLSAAIRDGALGWLTKTSPGCESVAAVRAVAAGELSISCSSVFDALRAGDADEAAEADGKGLRLTPREQAVLDCLAEGLTRGEAADALGVSINTVRTHIQNILGKLDVRSSLAAVAKARRCGLVT